jgi:hypothetical protein
VQLNQFYSLLSCLFFSCGFVLHVLSWFFMLSFSVCRNPSRIFCSHDLVVICCFSFCLSWKTFIIPSILNDSLAGYSNLELNLFSFYAQNTSLDTFLAFKFSVGTSAVILISLPLHVIYFFSLTPFNILSLTSVIVV